MTVVDAGRCGARHSGVAAELAPGTVRAYVALTKPRIIELLLVTTVPTMFLAAGGVPNIRLVLATFVGGSLAAGSANALNCYVDRDIDRLMGRTGHRPLATARGDSARGVGLRPGAYACLSLAIMAIWVNPLATRSPRSRSGSTSWSTPSA